MQLAEYLNARSLTAKAFAELVGVDASMVTRWRNRKTVPGRNNLRAISKATDGLVTANDFVADLPATADRPETCPAPSAVPGNSGDAPNTVNEAPEPAGAAP